MAKKSSKTKTQKQSTRPSKDTGKTAKSSHSSTTKKKVKDKRSQGAAGGRSTSKGPGKTTPHYQVSDAALVSAGAVEHAEESRRNELEREHETQQKLIERERSRREEQYDAAVAGLFDAPTAAFGIKRARRELPVRILAEGDSWFDFPFGGKPFRNGDVIAKLASMIPYPILNDAVRGDEVRQLLGVRQRQRLEDRLRGPCDFNALLFSGGGNDIVGDAFCLWLRSKSATSGDPHQAIDEVAFAHALGVVRTGYEQLLDMRDQIIREEDGRRIAVFFHGYDFAIPSGRGVCGHGPWLKPSLDYRGWKTRSDAKLIVQLIMERFASMLRDLASRRNDVYFIETQGTLNSRQWNDELHPKGAGFERVAVLFAAALREAFPGDIP